MENLTELCKIAYKYRTDKCPQINHAYTPYYYNLLKDRKYTIKKVLEMGIGCPRTMRYTTNYLTGASLFMWRDFFPNAQIYGADKLAECMLEADRIKTFICDETKKEDLYDLIKKTGSDIDLFIDDGIHRTTAQAFLCKTVMPLLKKEVIYIIEDVGRTVQLEKLLKPYVSYSPYLEGRDLKHGNANKLMVVKNR